MRVIKVDPADAWTCERCDQADVVAYVIEPGEEVTTGYCAACLEVVRG